MAADDSSATSRRSIFEASAKYFLEPIAFLLEDDSITEIMVNGCDNIYVERQGRLERTGLRFASEDALRSAINNISQWVGREITEEHPVLDARLPNGSRVHAILPPSARDGTYLTIRKFARQAYTLDDFVRFGSISPAAKEFLGLCVRLRKNILIAGGTGTGKTALLGGLSREIPEQERIIVIEDTAELRLIQCHSLYLEAKHADSEGRGGLNVRQLFHNSLRMRPDRIIVGEVRAGEALDMIQSMLSGHGGSMSTIHAETPRDALIRLETLSLMSDVDIPVYVARTQVAAAIDLVVQIARFTDDGSRKVVRISELEGLDQANQYQLRDIFVSQMVGRTPDGRMIVSLNVMDTQPTFARAPFEQGLDSLIHLTRSLWSGDA
jgi:pilus assembly protein CpaF